MSALPPKPPFAYIDNDVVTRSHLDGGAFGQFARHLLWEIICDLHQRAIGYRINFVTEKRIARELILRTRIQHVLVVQLHEIDGKTLGHSDAAIDRKCRAAMIAVRRAASPTHDPARAFEGWSDNDGGRTDLKGIAHKRDVIRRLRRGIAVANRI